MNEHTQECRQRDTARFEAIADKIIAESLEWQTPRFAVELSALDVMELEVK